MKLIWSGSRRPEQLTTLQRSATALILSSYYSVLEYYFNYVLDLKFRSRSRQSNFGFNHRYVYERAELITRVQAKNNRQVKLFHHTGTRLHPIWVCALTLTAKQREVA